MSDLIAIKFKVEGFEGDQAFNLAEAKTKLLAGGYDAVLSDYLLPDGNFLDLLAEVRSDASVANVPIILATNYIEDLSQDKAKELKIAEVIVKYQVVPAQMVQKVKALLGGGQDSPVASPGPVPEAGGQPAPVVQPEAVQPVQPSPVPTSPTQGAVPPGTTPSQPAVSVPPPTTEVPVTPAAPPVPVSTPEPTPTPAPVTPADPTKSTS